MRSGNDDVEDQMICTACDASTPSDEIEEGECPQCRNSDYGGPTFCCGAIYEEGEYLCASCGEAL